MQLWKVCYGLVAFAFFAESPAHANTMDDCWKLSKNCACVVPAIESRLGSDKTEVVFRSWVLSYSRDLKAREEFARDKARAVDEAFFQYGQIKSLIGFQCGTLDFDDD